MDIEKLENLPSRQKFYEHVNSKGQLYANKEYHRYHMTDSKYYRKVRLVVRGSVGKHVNVVYSKVRPLIYKLEESNPYNYFVDRFVERADIYNGKPYRLNKRRYHRYGELHGIYFGPDGIIRNNPYVKKRNPDNINRSYSKQNRINKKYREVYENNLLKMINRIDLYRFYTQLKQKEKSLINTINKQPNDYPVLRTTYEYNRTPIPDPGQYLRKRISEWHLWERFRKRDVEKALAEIKPIQEDIKQLEDGNYDVFFKSNVYLYSLQKECHHFETP